MIYTIVLLFLVFCPAILTQRGVSQQEERARQLATTRGAYETFGVESAPVERHAVGLHGQLARLALGGPAVDAQNPRVRVVVPVVFE